MCVCECGTLRGSPVGGRSVGSSVVLGGGVGLVTNAVGDWFLRLLYLTRTLQYNLQGTLFIFFIHSVKYTFSFPVSMFYLSASPVNSVLKNSNSYIS